MECVRFVEAGNVMVGRLLDRHMHGIHVYVHEGLYANNLHFELRLVCLCLVLLAQHCIFVVEQPAGSLLPHHRRFSWLINKIAWVPWLVKQSGVSLAVVPMQPRCMECGFG